MFSGLLVSIFGPAIASKLAGFLWKYRWWIGGAIAALVIAGTIWGMKLYIGYLQGQVRDWKIRAETASQVNEENLKSYAALQAEKAAAEKLLAGRLARKSKEADRLGELVQHIVNQEASHACADSAAVRAALDGLRLRATGSAP